uniref:Uncharacterized protein n=1 Tax=uncultured bacterium 1062 TaxID=548898 RepID=B8R8W8_9BACT|nr:hypothetical protein [uncultured bacterium 1062]
MNEDTASHVLSALISSFDDTFSLTRIKQSEDRLIIPRKDRDRYLRKIKERAADWAYSIIEPGASVRLDRGDPGKWTARTK